MTLLAYHLQPHKVEVITDSLAYTADAAVLRPASKCIYFPHAATAITATGAAELANMFTQWMYTVDADDVDTVALRAAEAAQRFADLVDPARSIHAVFLGWSNTHRRYLGYQLIGGGAAAGWAREWQPIDVMWNRAGYRGDLTGSAFVVSLALPGIDRTPGAASYARLADSKPPSTVQEWVDLAVAFRHASIATPVEDRVLIGGDLIYTVMEGAAVMQRAIHRFDDTGVEFASLVAGTANPAGAQHKWTGVGRNDPCPCRSGRKYKQCHDPRREGAPSV